MVEQMMLRNDVEDGGACDLVRMIERHAMQYPGTAVMTGGPEAIEAECRHHLDLVLRHGSKRVGGVILAARRFFRIAVTPQVGADNGEFLSEPRRQFVPARMRERVAVQQQQRRAAAAVNRNDAGP